VYKHSESGTRIAEGGKNVSSLVRISIAIESHLLTQLDQLFEERSYASRSDGFRQVFREVLTQSAWSKECCQAVVTLTLICQNSCASLSRRLTALQRAELDLIVSTMRVILACDTCLDVVILKGDPERLKTLASQLCGLKGVYSGKLVVAAAQGHSRDAFIANRTRNRRNSSHSEVLNNTVTHQSRHKGLKR
jgi:CopG family nickel-responsive transcriptional regulator